MTADEMAAMCVEFERVMGVPSSLVAGFPVARIRRVLEVARQSPGVAEAMCAEMLRLRPGAL